MLLLLFFLTRLSGVLLIRGSGTVPFAAERVRAAICTPSLRKFWEDGILDIKVMQTIILFL